MAQGDVFFFDQYLVDVQEALHNQETDSFNLFLTIGTTTPTVTTSDPRYGAGGGTNLLSEEVSAGGNYSAGGASVANPSVVLTGGAAVFDGDNVSWAQNASNPTNARWGFIRNATDAGNRILGAVDLGSSFDMTTGDLNVNWNASGISSLNQA